MKSRIIIRVVTENENAGGLLADLLGSTMLQKTVQAGQLTLSVEPDDSEEFSEKKILNRLVRIARQDSTSMTAGELIHSIAMQSL